MDIYIYDKRSKLVISLRVLTTLIGNPMRLVEPSVPIPKQRKEKRVHLLKLGIFYFLFFFKKTTAKKQGTQLASLNISERSWNLMERWEWGESSD